MNIYYLRPKIQNKVQYELNLIEYSLNTVILLDDAAEWYSGVHLTPTQKYRILLKVQYELNFIEYSFILLDDAAEWYSGVHLTPTPMPNCHNLG